MALYWISLSKQWIHDAIFISDPLVRESAYADLHRLLQSEKVIGEPLLYCSFSIILKPASQPVLLSVYGICLKLEEAMG